MRQTEIKTMSPAYASRFKEVFSGTLILKDKTYVISLQGQIRGIH